ncbi:MAG TPA: XdhC/CoxI family protein [Gaiellaceae bacterium]|nr:XdhC/CoxI family protein [Gaiellaceae bacterium]
MRDILDTLARWKASGAKVATATVVSTERSAPRDPGAMLAVSESGDVAGSVTGGCVEPAVFEEAREVLAGGGARLRTYGIADEEAFEVGLPCGGTVHIFVDAMDPATIDPLAKAIEEERPVARVVPVSGPNAGAERLVFADEEAGDEIGRTAQELLAAGETAVVRVGDDEVFVDSFAPRPNMYVFGAVDHAAAVAEIGRFLGYRVTVCDARAKFVTTERFPEADELVVEWPDRFLERSPVDERTAICVLTHDHKFDIPALKAALETNAGYIGAMGSRRTTEQRRELLRAEGVSDEELARIHAPIGLRIGARTPQEVAVSVAAQLIEVLRAPKESRAEAVTP